MKEYITPWHFKAVVCKDHADTIEVEFEAPGFIDAVTQAIRSAHQASGSNGGFFSLVSLTRVK